MSRTIVPVTPLLLQSFDPLLAVIGQRELLVLARSASIFYRALQPELKRRQLLHAVVWSRADDTRRYLADASKSQQILTEVLTQKVNVIEDPSGKLIKNITPFQAALCSSDVALCELFLTHFRQIPDGLFLMQQQIKEIFPDGIENTYQTLQLKVFHVDWLVEKIKCSRKSKVKQILEGKRRGTLYQELEIFRRMFHAQSHAERIYNPYHLQQALELYNTFRAACASSRASLKNDLFCLQLIGFIQRYLAPVELQRWAQDSLAGENYARSFKLQYRRNPTHTLEVLPLEVRRGLGYEYWAAFELGAAHTAENGQWIKWVLDEYRVVTDRKIKQLAQVCTTGCDREPTAQKFSRKL